MSKGEQVEEGLVKEILSKGDLTAEEMKQDLRKGGVSFMTCYDRPVAALFSAATVLWLLPAIAEWSGWGFLGLLARLPRVRFPLAVMVVGAVLFVAALSLEARVTSLRHKQGGCHDVHETVVIVKEKISC